MQPYPILLRGSRLLLPPDGSLRAVLLIDTLPVPVTGLRNPSNAQQEDAGQAGARDTHV
jgi:hypothetical protein